MGEWGGGSRGDRSLPAEDQGQGGKGGRGSGIGRDGDRGLAGARRAGGDDSRALTQDDEGWGTAVGG